KIYSLLATDAALYAGTFGGGVFRSTDQGRSWTQLNAGLTNTYVHALAVMGTTLYAGTEDGVFRLANQVSSWMPSSLGFEHTDIESFAVLGTTLFAGTAGGGVYRSTDGGNNWTPVNRGLPVEAYIPALAVVGTTLFAGSEFGGGVFRSTDQG